MAKGKKKKVEEQTVEADGNESKIERYRQLLQAKFSGQMTGAIVAEQEKLALELEDQIDLKQIEVEEREALGLDETVQEYVDAKAAEDAEAEDIDEDEEADEDEEEKGESEEDLTERFVLPQPYRKCQACLHLQPNLEEEAFKKGFKPNHFDCITESRCPARRLQLIFDPFDYDGVAGEVERFRKTGDLSILQKLYAQAEELGEATSERLHNMVIDTLTPIAVATDADDVD